MSEEERRRKIIIDSAAALVRGMECMRNTMLLTSSSNVRGQTDDSMVDKFKELADALAVEAARIEKRCSGE